MFKELLRIIFLIIAGSLIGHFQGVFDTPPVSFDLNIDLEQKIYKILIINESKKADRTSIDIYFSTRVCTKLAVLEAEVKNGGWHYDLKPRCTSDTSFIIDSSFTSKERDTSPISLKPSDRVKIKISLQDSTIDISTIKEPLVCLSCANFPKTCSTDRKECAMKRWQAIGLFVLLSCIVYGRRILPLIDKMRHLIDEKSRVRSFNLQFRKIWKESREKAEEFLVKELKKGDINARCFFSRHYKRTIERNMRYYSPHMDSETANSMFDYLVCGIIQGLGECDFSRTTLTEEVEKHARTIMDEILKAKLEQMMGKKKQEEKKELLHDDTHKKEQGKRDPEKEK